MATATLSKSQVVRDYRKEHPNDNPKAIVAALKKQGIKVSLATAGKVRYEKGAKKPRLRRPPMGYAEAAGIELRATPTQLREAKRLVEAFEGALN